MTVLKLEQMCLNLKSELKPKKVFESVLTFKMFATAEKAFTACYNITDVINLRKQKLELISIDCLYFLPLHSLMNLNILKNILLYFKYILIFFPRSFLLRIRRIYCF